MSTSFSGSMKIGTPLSSTCDKAEEGARPKTFLVITERGKRSPRDSGRSRRYWRSESIKYDNWDAITDAARTWCMRQREAKESKNEEGMPVWSFNWEGPKVNVARREESILVAQNFVLEGDDLAYYQKIGGHDWRVMMRMTNAQLGRTEIGFSTDPMPGFLIADTLYDDAFLIDELSRRVRNVALTSRYLLMVHKHLKIQARMKYAQPDPEWTGKTPEDDGQRTDLEQDRLNLSIGGTVGGIRFDSPDRAIDAIVLYVLSSLEEKYEEAIEERHLHQEIDASGVVPEHLVKPAIKRLKDEGYIFEVEPGKLRRTPGE